ncbi:MAG: 30S ribosomal protein S18 [Candidatus Omnitrophota bacterium]|nr:30S ribosomal protein S18 [Candidatus Omnitrophota bacterium]
MPRRSDDKTKKKKLKTKRFDSKEKFFRKKSCRFCLDKTESIDYKDPMRLKRFVTEKGKIMPSRLTGNCAMHQRKIAVAVKRARYVALLPYVGE